MSNRKTKKWFTSVASLTLLLQAGQPIMSYAMENEKSNEPQVFLYQDSVSTPTHEMSQWNFQAMKAQLAFDGGYTGKGVKIALVDTGIAPHKDLKIAGGVSTVDGLTSYIDTNGHGTHVAGIINAQRNDIGMVGIAPDAEIYAVKAVTGDARGNLSDLVEGIQWAIDNKMNIISMSVGIETDEPELRAVIKKAYEAGIILVSASGNNGNTSPVGYPAKYPEVISVSAVDQSMNQGSFSSQGEEVDFTAPGVDVVSTYLNDQYAMISGTSQATPHVVGLLALLKEKYPTKSSRELENELQFLAQDLGDVGKDNVFGYGFISYQNLDNSIRTVTTPTTYKSPEPVEETVKVETFTEQQKLYITYAERYIGYVEQYKRTSYATTAQSYINKLPYGPKRTELQTKLDNAVALVTGATTSTTTTTPTTTPTTTTPTNETTETQTTTETFTTTQQTYITYAERYIGYVVQYKNTSYATTAQAYINKLPNGAKRTELQTKLNNAIALVTGEATPSTSDESSSSTTTQPTTTVNEPSTSTETTPTTTTSTETFTATQQMYITYAERYIGYVVQYKNTSYATTAQAYINKLPNGAKKTELQNKLNEAVASITA